MAWFLVSWLQLHVHRPEWNGYRHTECATSTPLFESVLDLCQKLAGMFRLSSFRRLCKRSRRIKKERKKKEKRNETWKHVGLICARYASAQWTRLVPPRSSLWFVPLFSVRLVATSWPSYDHFGQNFAS